MAGPDTHRRRFALIAVLTAMLAFVGLAVAQELEDTREGSQLVRFVEDTISAPNRQIRLIGLQGALSSDVRLERITISDEDGIWLSIETPELIWSRSALLSGRLSIERLSAESLDFPRMPAPDDSAPSAEATSFAIPELPLAVAIDALAIGEATFGEEVFGLESTLSLDGSFSLEDGNLATSLEIARLDGPGGQMTLDATAAGEELNIDFSLTEPDDGVVANLLNIPDRPPVRLTVSGGGAFEALDVDLALDVDANRILTGELTTSRGLLAGATRAQFSLGGPLASILPPQERAFFGGTSRLAGDMLLDDDGTTELTSLLLTSGAIQFSASGLFGEDGFPQRLRTQFALRSPDGEEIELPGQGSTRLAGANLSLDFGNRADGAWTLQGTLADLVTQGFRLGQVSLDGGGRTAALADPESRMLTYDVSVAARELSATDEDVAQAVGDRLDARLAGQFNAGKPLVIELLNAVTRPFELTATGEIGKGAFDGAIALSANDLAVFSGLADRPLGGSVDLNADGTIALAGGGFDLAVDGQLTDARTGEPIADRLIAGITRLSGRAARTPQGLSFDQLRVANPQADIMLDGDYASDLADLTAALAVTDIALLDETSTGRLTADARLIRDRAEVDGQPVLQPMSISAEIALPAGRLSGRSVQDLAFGFAGEAFEGRVSGELSGDGFIGGDAVALRGSVERSEELTALRDLVARIGGASVSGGVEMRGGLYEGALEIDAPDISTVAALALAEASGAVNGTLSLSREGNAQSVDADLEARNIVYSGNRIGRAEISAQIENALGQPLVSGRAQARDVMAGGVAIAELSATAEPDGDGFGFQAAALMEDGADIQTAGAIAFAGTRTDIDLQRLDVRSPIANARLVSPTRVTLDTGTTTISDTNLAIGSGSLRIAGSVADEINLDGSLNAIPLDIANAFAGRLGLGGTLSGDFSARGTADAPRAAFDVSGSGVTASALANAQVLPLNVQARGNFADNTVRLAALDIRNGQGIALSASGTIPLQGSGLQIDARLEALPVAIANTFSPGLGAGGQISGTARVSGSTADPAVAFDLNGAGLTAAPLADNGITPLGVSATGAYGGNNLQLNAVRVTNGQGIDVSASGSLSPGARTLDISVDGSAPLSVANARLVSRGTRVDGLARFQMQIGGALSAPRYSGLLSVAGGTLTDPQTNLRLEAINVLAGIDGDRVSISNASASLGGGGGINLSGTIGLAGGLPADLRLQLDGARYSDGQLFYADLDSVLTITGPLSGGALIAGNVNINRAEITVPETFAGQTDLLPVTHISPDPPTQRTLARLAEVLPRGRDGAPSAPFRLDIAINAPNQIFVRGRGLDAELGGQVRLTGPVTAIAPVGGFDLIRGRLSILSKRLDFTEGSVTLTGSLDPFVTLVAQTTSGDITAFIRLVGPISDLRLELSSSPDLPEDEILSHVLFGEDISSLSPLQIASLASAAAGLGGGGVVDDIRSGLGVDDLDITTGSDGNVAVRAGRYIDENIYLGVEAGADGVETTINLDITESLKARGAVGSDGQSSLGVFFERDY